MLDVNLRLFKLNFLVTVITARASSEFRTAVTFIRHFIIHMVKKALFNLQSKRSEFNKQVIGSKS